MDYDKVIDKIVDKLQVPVEHLWEILLKQGPIYCLTEIISYVVIMLVIIVSIIIYRKTMLKYNLDDEVFWITSIILGSIALLITLIFIFSFPNIITGFVNPEYWALKHFIEK